MNKTVKSDGIMEGEDFNEEMYSDDDPSNDENTDDDDEEEEGDDEPSSINNHRNNDEAMKDLPLFQRLQILQSNNEEMAYNNRKNHKPSNKRLNHKQSVKTMKIKKDKNAPATARSNRPVPILRDNTCVFISHHKSIDPRFSDATGVLNYSKFMKNYSFLDEKQEQEINELNKAMKKTKNVDMKESLKKTLDQTKQQMTERRRKVKLDQKVKQIYAAENEKVK